MGVFSWRRAPSIRARMTATFALALALVLLSSGLFWARQTRRAAERRARELLEAADQRARLEAVEGDNKSLSLLDLARREQGELTVGGVGLLVLDGRGRALWRSRHDVPDWPTREELADWRFGNFSSKGQTLIFALHFDRINADLHERQRLLFLIALAIFGAATTGAWLLVGHTLSPINRLSHQAQNASIERLKVRLSAPSRDAEIVGLVATLNTLLARLEGESQARGRFYAAASHELRTPLQSLIGEVDVILDRPREAADYREALEVVRGQSLRLTNLVQELLQLNQLDTAAAPPPASRANLADILERTLAPLQPQIEDKNLEIARDLPDVEIEAPLSHLEMLLRNLVENAVKYAPQNGQISVKLEACGSQALLQLENDAQIAPDEDVNAWFEPFFRPDAARTAANGGNGLGLAICRAIADCNGWKLELSAPKRRVRVRVEWQKLAPSRG